MKTKTNPTIKIAIFILTVITGITVAVLLHQNTFFKHQPVYAEIDNITEVQFDNATTGNGAITDTANSDDNTSINVWTASDASGIGVYYRRYDWDGTVLDATDQLVNTTTTNTQYQPQVAMDSEGNFVVVWASDHLVSGDYNIYLSAYQSDGSIIGGGSAEVAVSTPSAGYDRTEPSIAIDYDGSGPTRFIVSWTEQSATDTDIHLKRYDVDFSQTVTAPSLVGSELQLNTTTDDSVSDVAMNNNGEFMVTWFEDDTTDSIKYQPFQNDGTAIGTPTTVNTATALGDPVAAAAKESRPDIYNTDDSRYIIAYEADFDAAATGAGIGAKIVTCDNSGPACSLSSIEYLIVADSTGTETYTSPDIAADHLGNFTVVWQDSEIDGNSNGIAAQSYNYKGQQVGSQFQVNTSTSSPNVVTGSQIAPAIAMNTDGFYTVSFNNQNDSHEYFKAYINEIFKVLTESLPHTSDPSNTQSSVATDMSSTFNQVFVWKDLSTSPSSIRFTLQQIDMTDPTNPVISVIQSNTAVVASNSADNPDVSFFKDATNCNKFIVVWEDSGTGQDIYYQLYDSSGTPIGSATVLNTATTGDQTRPVVSAGRYNDGTTDIQEFAAGWVDENTSTYEAVYHAVDAVNPDYTYASLDSTPDLPRSYINVDLHPSNQHAIYAFEKFSSESFSDTNIRQTDAGVTSGASTEVNSGHNLNRYPDVAFITDEGVGDPEDFVVVFQSKPTVLTGQRLIRGWQYEYNDAGNPTDISLAAFDIEDPFVNGFYPRIDAVPTNDSDQQHLLVTMYHQGSGIVDKNIYGQFMDYQSVPPVNFGPLFRVNSTQSGDQFGTDVAYNQYGLGIVAWEGVVSTDGAGIGYQLVQNPLNTQDVTPLEPVCEQIITAGGLSMIAPSSVSFPPVDTSATETVTQEVSIRDATYGGDVKYLEVHDAKGEAFTLYMQITDFTSAEDGKVYITNENHFRVKNWDDSDTNTDAGCTVGTPELCFLTEESSNPTTLFELHTNSETYAAADANLELASKGGAVGEEIGRWKFYPEFEITIPPVIPAGNHEATITFTLVN